GYAAADASIGKVYVTYGSNNIAEIDGSSNVASLNTITGTYDCATGSSTLPPSLVLDPATGHLITAFGSHVCEIDPTTYTQIASTVTTGQNSKQGMAINPTTGKIFVANKNEKTLSVVSTESTPSDY